MKKYVNASAVGKPEINSISLKSLYDSGVHFLNFGGEIVKTDDNGEEYYDLYSQNTGELFVSDGEMVEFTKHYNISTGLPYWVATTDDGKGIYLTNDEYRIAVYHNNYNIKSSTSIKCSTRDPYKVDWLKKALQNMQEDEYFVPSLKVNDNGRYIGLDEGAIQVLIDYYN